MIEKDTNKPMVLHKHNLMVKAKYNLTTLETKLYLNILYFLQARIKDPTIVITDQDNIVLQIPKVSFEDIVPGKQYLEDGKFLRIFEGLRSKPIYYKISKKWTLSGFINKVVIDEENPKMVKIEMDKFILPMLMDYTENGYTPLNLALMFGLEGMYSYRLYELIRLWSNTKNVITYTIDELKEYLMLEDKKSYNTYANIKNKIIIPAIDELNDLEIFEIKFKENKVGKKVHSIDFIVKDLDKRKYFDKKDIKQVIEYEEKGNNKTLETIEVDNSINTSKQEKECFKMENKEETNKPSVKFFIPDESIFTIGTLRLFKKDFGEYDFKKSYMNEAFEVSAAITMEQDNTEIIETKSYKFFKGTLNNKIKEYKDEYEKDLQHKKEMDEYWKW